MKGKITEFMLPLKITMMFYITGLQKGLFRVKGGVRNPLSSYPVIDVFAGPGGLGEGFSSLRHSNGTTPFRMLIVHRT